MSFVPEQGVVDGTGRCGVVVKRISSEVYTVLFGLRPFGNRSGSYTTETLTEGDLRVADLQEVLDWRASQGFDGPEVQAWRKVNGHAYSRHYESK
jgi:hypothetical protein